MDDTISRQTVLTMLDDIEGEVMDGEGYQYGKWSEYVEQLPAAQPPLDEWCTDCKEYDKEKHCCHRFTKVIRETVEELKAEPQRTRGRWVEVTDGTCVWKVCDQCGEKPLWNEWKTDRCESDYCPNCGADMRGEQDGQDD